MKKLLALVLALVMTLSLAVVGSNAAFKDADKGKDIQKYKRLLESDRIDMKSLRALAWKGIPSEYRAVTWKLLLVLFSKGVSRVGILAVGAESSAGDYPAKASRVQGVHSASVRGRRLGTHRRRAGGAASSVNYRFP